MRFRQKSVYFFLDRSAAERVRKGVYPNHSRKNSPKSGPKHIFCDQNGTHQFRSWVQISPPIISLNLNKMDTFFFFCWGGFICRSEMRFSPKNVYLFLDRSAKERVRKGTYPNHFRIKNVQKVANNTYILALWGVIIIFKRTTTSSR